VGAGQRQRRCFALPPVAVLATRHSGQAKREPESSGPGGSDGLGFQTSLLSAGGRSFAGITKRADARPLPIEASRQLRNDFARHIRQALHAALWKYVS
jgi:hypothetical protein